MPNLDIFQAEADQIQETFEGQKQRAMSNTSLSVEGKREWISKHDGLRRAAVSSLLERATDWADNERTRLTAQLDQAKQNEAATLLEETKLVPVAIVEIYRARLGRLDNDEIVELYDDSATVWQQLLIREFGSARLEREEVSQSQQQALQAINTPLPHEQPVIDAQAQLDRFSGIESQLATLDRERYRHRVADAYGVNAAFVPA